MLCGRSDTKGRLKFPVLKPLDAPHNADRFQLWRNGHYRDKNLLVNTFVALTIKIFCLREVPRFQRRGLDAFQAVGLSTFE